MTPVNDLLDNTTCDEPWRTVVFPADTYAVRGRKTGMNGVGSGGGSGNDGGGDHGPDNIDNPLIKLLVNMFVELLRTLQVAAIEIGVFLSDVLTFKTSRYLVGAIGILIFGAVYNVLFFRWFREWAIAGAVVPISIMSAVGLVVLGIGRWAHFDRDED